MRYTCKYSEYRPVNINLYRLIREFAAHETRGRAIALISAMDGVLVYMVLGKKLSLDDIARYFEDIFIRPVRIDK